MEDIESIVDQVLAGNSSGGAVPSWSPPPPPPAQDVLGRRVDSPRAALVSPAAPQSSSRAAPQPRRAQRVNVPPSSSPLLSSAPAGSVEDLVERILRGESVEDLVPSTAAALATSSRAQPSWSLRQEEKEPQEDVVGVWDAPNGAAHRGRGAQRVGVSTGWRGVDGRDYFGTSPPSVPVVERDGRGLSTGLTSRSSEPRYASAEEDPLLRRFALWQEKKEVKRIQGIYEALLKEKSECTFQPDLRPEALLPNQVPLEAPQPSHEAGLMVMMDNESSIYGGGGGHGGTQRGTSESRRSSTWHSLLAPSRLYDQNKAWGFEEHVERLRVAQEEREQLELEEEYERTRYADFSTFRRGPTKFEPFQLSSSNATRSRVSTAGAARASGTAKKVSPAGAKASSQPRHTGNRINANNDTNRHSNTSNGDAGVSPVRSSWMAENSAFDALAPQIRQALLFTPEMNARLRQATATTLHSPLWDANTGGSHRSAEDDASDYDGLVTHEGGERLPPAGHFSNTSVTMAQR